MSGTYLEQIFVIIGYKAYIFNQNLVFIIYLIFSEFCLPIKITVPLQKFNTLAKEYTRNSCIKKVLR